MAGINEMQNGLMQHLATIHYLNRLPCVFTSNYVRQLKDANDAIRALRDMGVKTLSCRAGETIEIVVDRSVGVIDVSAFPGNVHIRRRAE
jgi:hypothetical protein